MSCADVVALLGPHEDGALAADDWAVVDEHLAGCEACRSRQEALVAQAAALRETVRSREADFSGFADRVLAARRGPSAEGAKVYVLESFRAHRTLYAGSAGVALAACAALFVALLPAPRVDEPVAVADNSPQVEEVDFGTHDGAVLQLPGDTTVIWMSDDRSATP